MKTKLLPHNKTAYQKVMDALEKSDRTCVIHPTGTGKSYLIAAVCENYEHILILGPNDFVLNQVHDVLSWRKSGISYMTYMMLCHTDEPATGYDLIILDEFHRAGAQEWGAGVQRLLDANPQAKVFGTTATPIRYLDNERNMAEELFHNNIASSITIGEAWSRNILPIPTYVTGLFDFKAMASDAEARISRSELSEKAKRERLFRLSNAKLEWEKSYGMPSILGRHLSKDTRRVIVFCSDVERLEAMHDTVIGWFNKAGFTIDSISTVHTYMSTNDVIRAMEDFESDEGTGIRLMFSVNMLNEGIHIPRVGAVLMLRTTSSKIIYMQQLGRCLTAANTERPVVLDMVDNITTTAGIRAFANEFDTIEQMMARENAEYKPRSFVVTDYNITLRNLIQKLSPDNFFMLTVEERIAKVKAFIQENQRMPKRSDGDVYLCWNRLLTYDKVRKSNHEIEEILNEYYSRSLSPEKLMEKIHTLKAFVEKNRRIPSTKKSEVRWRNFYDYVRKRHSSIPEVKEILQMKAQISEESKEQTFRKHVDKLREFTKTYGRMPVYGDNGYISRLFLKNFYPTSPEYCQIISEYPPKERRSLDQMIEHIERFAKKHNRLPCEVLDGKKMASDWYVIRKRRGTDNRVLKLIEQYPETNVKKENEIRKHQKLVQKVLDFVEKYDRLPKLGEARSEEERRAASAWHYSLFKYSKEKYVIELCKKYNYKKRTIKSKSL